MADRRWLAVTTARGRRAAGRRRARRLVGTGSTAIRPPTPARLRWWARRIAASRHGPVSSIRSTPSIGPSTRSLPGVRTGVLGASSRINAGYKLPGILEPGNAGCDRHAGDSGPTARSTRRCFDAPDSHDPGKASGSSPIDGRPAERQAGGRPEGVGGDDAPLTHTSGEALPAPRAGNHSCGRRRSASA